MAVSCPMGARTLGPLKEQKVLLTAEPSSEGGSFGKHCSRCVACRVEGLALVHASSVC